MLCDYHIHSEYSDDSHYPMDEVVKKAIELGLEEICFTDHVDYGIKIDHDDPAQVRYDHEGNALYNVDYPRYFQQIEDLKKAYPGIIIKRGLEFGIQTQTIPLYEKLYKTYPMDFIILSIHQVGNEEFWNGDFQKTRQEREYYETYYQEMYDVMKTFKHYSILGHLDMIKRYDDHDGYDAFANHKEIITKILKQAIEDGKGIEVNTSSFRYGLDDLMPSREILKLYHDLGGDIITIGSDSHQEAHLGAHIKDVQEELKAMGYTKIYTFDHMKPLAHEL